MVTKVQKWGNSQGLRLPRQMLATARIEVGDEVNVSARNGMIVIAPMKRRRGKRSLRELVSRIPKKYKSGEFEWGKSVGLEVW